MCNETVNQNNNLANIFESILILQQKGSICQDDTSCSRPFLGPTTNPSCLNTRPINIYTCCNNTLWTMPYSLNGENNTSDTFRIESIEDNCVTFRVLAPTENGYSSTQDFFTIKLSCIGAIKCLQDTFVSIG